MARCRLVELRVEAYFWLIPEIHYGSYADLTQYGGFVKTSLAAIYHL